MVRAIAMAAALWFAGTASAVGQEAPPAPLGPAPAPGEPAAVPEAPAPAPDPVVAIVNGERILASDVVLMYESLNPDIQQIPFQGLYAQLITATINRKLAIQRARAENLYTDPEIIRLINFWADQIVEDRMLQRSIEEAITQEAVDSEYNLLVAQVAEVEDVRISHILVATEEEAFDIIGIAQGGADFAQLARERSLGPSSVDGGDLDFVSPGQTIPEFEIAAFALGIGQITPEPVQTEFGWHVIKVTDRRPGQAPPFEEVAEYLQDQIARRAIDDFYAGLNEGAAISQFNFDGTPIEIVEEAPVPAPEPEPEPAPAAEPAAEPAPARGP